MNALSILIIDDEPANFDVIETFLAGQNYQLHYANTAQQGLANLKVFHPDLILLDVLMPEVSGLEMCRQIKAMWQWRTVPIMMVTCLTSKQSLAQGLAAGADGFISKPVDRLELQATVKSMLRIRQQYRQLESSNTQLEASNTQLESSNLRLEKIVHQMTAQLHTMILQDALTGLPNQRFVLKTLTDLSTKGKLPCGIVHLDCDQFKLVNGAFGEAVGDQLLREVANRLQQHVQPGDVLAHMGQDEFCYVLQQVQDEARLKSFIHNIQESFESPFLVVGYEVFLTVGIGATLANDSQQQPEEILQDVDIAMHRAKAKGTGSYQVFGPQMRLAAVVKVNLENDLQRALIHGEFALHYQPIFNLKDHTVEGVEALVRWQHPIQGMVLPSDFLPVLETTGLIIPVGLRVLTLACQQLARWQQQGWTRLSMNVNLSMCQFAYSGLLADVDRILATTGVDPAWLKLELTETVAIENIQQTFGTVEQLRARQIRISIDDFGTGYSSLEYLLQCPVDSLKIDQSFVSHLQPENINYHIVQTILSLAQKLELSVVAEGIETDEQSECLKQMGCESGQGYLFSAPLTADEIERHYLANTPQRSNVDSLRASF